MEQPEKYSAAEWDSIRERFQNSALNETEIAILGQNAGVSWPFKGETPLKYIDCTLDELAEIPGLIGKKSRIRRLMDILRETLAFDDPFSDLVDSVELDGVEDHTFERILAKFNIPDNYPADMVKFNADTRKLLQNEKADTLLEVIRFGQLIPHDSDEGEELRLFLNGLALKDEDGMAEHLPYRRGERGLHLPEEIGLIAGALGRPVQLALIQQSGMKLTEKEKAEVQAEINLEAEAELKKALEAMKKACEWFKEEASTLKAVFTEEGDPHRYFIPIQNLEVERIAVALARVYFGFSDGEQRSMIGRISGLFRR